MEKPYRGGRDIGILGNEIIPVIRVASKPSPLTSVVLGDHRVGAYMNVASAPAQ